MKKLIFFLFATVTIMMSCGNQTNGNSTSTNSTDSVDTVCTVDTTLLS